MGKAMKNIGIFVGACVLTFFALQAYDFYQQVQQLEKRQGEILQVLSIQQKGLAEHADHIRNFIAPPTPVPE